MKKTIRRTLAMLLIIATLLPILSISGFAASTKKYTLGKKVTLSTDSTWYKFTIPADGYLKVWSNKNMKWHIGTDKDNMDEYYSKGTQRIAIAKGTYYVKAKGVDSKTNMRIRFYQFSSPANYSFASAKSLGLKQKNLIIQTKRNNFSRYFKVTLTKAQKITLVPTIGELSANEVTIHDSKFRSQPIYKHADGEVGTKDVMPKGTYYVVLHHPAQAGLLDAPTGATMVRFYLKKY